MRTDPMAFNKEKMREAWHRLAGMPIKLDKHEAMPSLDSLRETEWSPQFEKMMRDRLVMGAFRYGLLHAKGKLRWDRLASCERRLAMYRETGDDNLLVDVANLCLLEFEEGTHPRKHIAKGDGTEHVTVKE